MGLPGVSNHPTFRGPMSLHLNFLPRYIINYNHHEISWFSLFFWWGNVFGALFQPSNDHLQVHRCLVSEPPNCPTNLEEMSPDRLTLPERRANKKALVRVSRWLRTFYQTAISHLKVEKLEKEMNRTWKKHKLLGSIGVRKPHILYKSPKINALFGSFGCIFTPIFRGKLLPFVCRDNDLYVHLPGASWSHDAWRSRSAWEADAGCQRLIKPSKWVVSGE